MKKQRILLITRNLPPLIGGMERLNWHIANELSKDHDVSIISHIEAKKTAPQNVRFYGVLLNPLPIFLMLVFFQTFLRCLVQRTDILFAGSGLTAPIVVFWAKIFRKKSIVYIHGLDVENKSVIYHKVWIPFIRKADHIVANSTSTQELCIRNHIPFMKISIIHPGVDFPPLPREEEHIQHLKSKFNLKNKKVLISVGRLTERKGINEFIQQALPEIVKDVPNVLLLIVGDTASHALNKNMQTYVQLLEAAKAYNVDQHIVFSGKVTDPELSSFFYLSDIHVFPIKYIPEDPEGFGMVAIEAAAHGTPTVAFAVGGVVDAIKQNETGCLIDHQDYQTMTHTLVQILEGNTVISEKMCVQYAEQFAWCHLKNKFEKIIVNL
ncbi:glycosyltransferase family 4 protein [Acinetobacter johnsonii]|uniref:glycosyltransferase family 4 protein n=1 Tax=Acinetobacter johnsonii TaxID=40214 RepID=UPI00244864EE|nr:glycosyltransferase family 4 protein [Acinetobacter johnsonii]MDH1706021.1 glycosyltransferase family 4 protein [Acinetobacter johnsonii]